MGIHGITGRQVELKTIISETFTSMLDCFNHTNLAFFKQVSTSEGNDEDICGCVASAEASQFNGGR